MAENTVEYRRKELMESFTFRVKMERPFGRFEWRLHVARFLMALAGRVVAVSVEFEQSENAA